MRSNFYSLSTITLVALLAACSKPTETVIPSDMSTWEKELIPKVRKLSDEEKKLLMAYLMRAKMGEVFGGKGVPLGQTVGQALDEQKKWQEEQEKKAAEERALKERLEKERAAAAAAMTKAVTVTLLSKIEREKDYHANRFSDEQVFKIGLKNTSDKELVGISGSLNFIDVFDKKVGAVTFAISERLKPGQEYTWTGSRRYNEFLDEHRAVWNLEEGKYTTRFIPEKLVFADGTKLTAEN